MVSKKPGCAQASLGSLFEAAVFDPERLLEIIGELSRRFEPCESKSVYEAWHRIPRARLPGIE